MRERDHFGTICSVEEFASNGCSNNNREEDSDDDVDVPLSEHKGKGLIFPLRRTKAERTQRIKIKAICMAVVLVATICVSVGTSSLKARSTSLSSSVSKSPSSSSANSVSFSLSRNDFDVLMDGDDNPFPNATCNHFSDYNDTCAFVREAEACAVDGGFINYLELPFCVLHSEAGAIVILLLWLIFLFIALGVTAEEYFCPALSVISDTLRLSHNVAGVTFLAFGNGAPDIFSVYSSINNADNGVQLALGELFGSGIFVTTIVLGAVAYKFPFTLTRRPFIRDVVTYLIAASWTYALLVVGEITTFSAIGFCAVYVLYVIVVVVGRHIYQSRKKKRKANPVEVKQQHARKEELQPPRSPRLQPRSIAEAMDVTESVGLAAALGKTALLIPHPIMEERSRSASMRNGSRSPQHFPITKAINIVDADEGEDEDTDEDNDEEAPLMHRRSEMLVETAWTQFFKGIVPFAREEWDSSGWFGKMYLIFSTPITVALRFTTPVVDYEEEGQNWVQYLQMLQLITSPVFFVFATGFGLTTIGDTNYPVWLLCVVVGGVLALIVWATSRASHPPKYQAAFGFMGFMVAVVWIYIVANEIVNLLQTLGRLFGISDAILGLTVLAWGNSIGDFVSNYTVAKQGYPRMAAGACFGGPALNVLLGIGISCAVACLNNDGRYAMHDQPSHQLKVSGGFLLLSLLSSLVYIPFNKFNASKKFGMYLCVLYAVYVITALTLEFM
eukprot:m.80796 g.80796  ORF g.80796 m.80796 type:complete len:729 (-) comp12032_c0_seq5:116-2302(-)